MILNEEQSLIINELDKNILLLASAGTGKTNTLAHRISNIINSKKAKSEEILCITFTNKACFEMRSRIEEIVGERAKDITIRTFHSFCFDLIKSEAKKRTDIFIDSIIFDEEDCKEIIKECNFYNYPVNKLQQFIELVKLEKTKINLEGKDLLKDYNLVVNNIFKFQREKIKSICSNRGSLDFKMEESLEKQGGALVIMYNTLLYNNHGLDFIDLTTKAKELLLDEDLVINLRNKFKYISIDEVQDTSTLEYSIIEKIFGSNNILLCGDMFQTIYGWRGSEPESILDLFKEKYTPREVIFTKNYRSTKYITNSSLSFLENAFNKKYNSIYKEKITAITKIEGEKIKLKKTNTLREEARYIFDQIRALENNNENISKICVLSRDNNYNISLSRELQNIIGYEGANFEFILVDQFKFFRRQEIKDIIAFLKLIANRYDNISLKRIVKRLPTGIGESTLNAIDSKEYREVGIALTDFIDENAKAYGEKYSVLVEEFQKDNIIIFDVESTGIDVTEDEIIQIAAIRINKDGQVIEKFEKFLKNKKSVESSFNVHGFSDEFLKKNGEDKEKVLKEFVDFSKDSVIVGHNVQYDINILTSELSRNNITGLSFKTFYDTLDIYRRFHTKLPNYKLETLSRIFSTENKPSHDAMDDILATKDLLVRAIKKDIMPTSLKRISLMNKHLKSFNKINDALNNLFTRAYEKRPQDIIVDIIKSFNIKTLYSGRGAEIEKEASEKIERLRDFYVLVKDLDDKNKSNRDSLLDIIKITGLSNGELENIIVNRTKKKRIPIITVHQSKGLEFDTVFISGLQEGVFPSYMSLKSDNIEEEMRTFYVALTRAKKRLYLTYHLYEDYGRENKVSRFINFIDKEYMDNDY
ncbi:UvrD-helicase domain-containing protein [Clostridium sp. Sa3CUN1]|uniref:DNA 3'-5' helicase n=1 Tax=Clostridium gallinarum TaxID=2762246 RepID=A0ABR8Q7A3_9CLOT|nr:3'-5' exonuclease [Clostridium gallinarum]MBD7916307.1 UvrD-helicase domain-containing protein [Clostridium gallinarum]